MYVEISRLFVFASFIWAAFLFKYIKINYLFIFWFIVLGVVVESFTVVYKEIWYSNTMPIGHFYMPLSFLCFALFFRTRLHGFISSNVIVGISVGFLFFCFINSLFIQNIFEFPNISGSIGAIILIGFSVALFYKIMTEAKFQNLLKESVVWINSGILIYYSANLFFYVMLNHLNSISIDAAIFAHKIYIGINMLFYTIISIGFWKARQQIQTK